jgi:hypothetical protein
MAPIRRRGDLQDVTDRIDADLLRAAGTKINDKRVYPLYKLADLSVRKRRGKQRLKLERVPLHECRAAGESSMHSWNTKVPICRRLAAAVAPKRFAPGPAYASSLDIRPGSRSLSDEVH